MEDAAVAPAGSAKGGAAGPAGAVSRLSLARNWSALGGGASGRDPAGALLGDRGRADVDADADVPLLPLPVDTVL